MKYRVYGTIHAVKGFSIEVEAETGPEAVELGQKIIEAQEMLLSSDFEVNVNGWMAGEET